MLAFDLTPDVDASEGHKSEPVIGHIRLEIKFGQDLPDPMCVIVPGI